MKNVARILLEFFKSWAGCDRIRIPPTEGRLLGLQPGDRLLIKNELYEVRSQIIDANCIVYRLTGEDLHYEMRVPTIALALTHHRGVKSGQLCCGNTIMDVFDDDVVVLSETGRAAERI